MSQNETSEREPDIVVYLPNPTNEKEELERLLCVTIVQFDYQDVFVNDLSRMQSGDVYYAVDEHSRFIVLYCGDDVFVADGHDRPTVTIKSH